MIDAAAYALLVWALAVAAVSGVALFRARHTMRQAQDHQRVPPRGVVRDEEQRRGRGLCARLGEPAHPHHAEALEDAAARVAREPRVEPAALPRRDHGAPRGSA
jgi:hypothetical protein